LCKKFGVEFGAPRLLAYFPQMSINGEFLRAVEVRADGPLIPNENGSNLVREVSETETEKERNVEPEEESKG
jgi:hypothetical protein